MAKVVIKSEKFTLFNKNMGDFLVSIYRLITERIQGGHLKTIIEENEIEVKMRRSPFDFRQNKGYMRFYRSISPCITCHKELSPLLG